MKLIGDSLTTAPSIDQIEAAEAVLADAGCVRSLGRILVAQILAALALEPARPGRLLEAEFNDKVAELAGRAAELRRQYRREGARARRRASHSRGGRRRWRQPPP